jgi:hypothetical protein
MNPRKIPAFSTGIWKILIDALSLIALKKQYIFVDGTPYYAAWTGKRNNGNIIEKQYLKDFN